MSSCWSVDSDDIVVGQNSRGYFNLFEMFLWNSFIPLVFCTYWKLFPMWQNVWKFLCEKKMIWQFGPVDWPIEGLSKIIAFTNLEKLQFCNLIKQRYENDK